MEGQDAPRRTRMPAAERRESILAAATAVFAEAGYQAAKVADIAARVGVSEPVVFQNFGSKPALFTAVLERAAAQASAAMRGAHFGPAGGLLAHVLGHVTGGHPAASHPESGHPDSAHSDSGHPGASPIDDRGRLFAVAVALAADPAAPEVRVAVLRTLAGHLAEVVRHGQRDGSVRAGLDPEPAAWLLVSLLATAPLRKTAMAAALEPAVAELAGRLFSPDHGA